MATKKKTIGGGLGKCVDGACEVLEAGGRPEGRQMRDGVAELHDRCVDALGQDGLNALARGDLELVLACFFRQRVNRR